MNKHEDILLDHNYDGIQEYDNPTPGWWNWLFAASIVFAFLYYFFFHIGYAGWTLDEEYGDAMAANTRKLYGDLELKPDQETLLKYMKEPKWMAVGQVVFKANCAQCHQADGSGGTGVNLTDDYYKNVKEIADIPRVVKNGAANGAMPAWGPRLHPNDIVMVSAYVATLRGQNLQGRPHEGDLIPPWPSAPAGAAETEPATTGG
ncbi:MAG: c-type cytochrome [Phycisphaerales bacterium]|nr:c-type cytochrome [Phycisphaerales bacterium]